MYARDGHRGILFSRCFETVLVAPKSKSSHDHSVKKNTTAKGLGDFLGMVISFAVCQKGCNFATMKRE